MAPRRSGLGLLCVLCRTRFRHKNNSTFSGGKKGPRLRKLSPKISILQNPPNFEVGQILGTTFFAATDPYNKKGFKQNSSDFKNKGAGRYRNFGHHELVTHPLHHDFRELQKLYFVRFRLEFSTKKLISISTILHVISYDSKVPKYRYFRVTDLWAPLKFDSMKLNVVKYRCILDRST